VKNFKVKNINSYLVHSLEMLLETVELIHIRFTIPLLVNPFINTILILTETKDLNAKFPSLQQLFAQVPVNAKAHFLSTLSLTENNQAKCSSSKYGSSSSSRSSYSSNSSSRSRSSSSSSYRTSSIYDLLTAGVYLPSRLFSSQQLLKRDYHG
jgi:hypothetical protein